MLQQKKDLFVCDNPFDFAGQMVYTSDMEEYFNLFWVLKKIVKQCF